MARKIVVAYYSHSGNTRHIAELIKAQLEGTLHEIVPTQSYPQNYNAIVQQAEKEINDGYKPQLKSKFDDIDFDILFIGSPNWWYTVAPPISSFLDGLKTEGKIIIPFITHGGGGLAKCLDAVSSLCPRADVLEPLSIYNRGNKDNEAKISSWLKKIL